MSLSLILIVVFVKYILAEIKHTAGGNDYCIIDGRPFRSGERIPRNHVCHICLCHLGKAECSWMNCPPPPEGCTEFSVSNYCNPTLYICSIPEHLKHTRERRSAENFSSHPDKLLKQSNKRKRSLGDCNVLGVPYKTGDLMGVASSFCMECRCGKQNMFCSPRCCFQYADFNENTTLREQQQYFRPQPHPLHYLK
ncbi:uncharacterized protein [Parasteatoda tepidariorum]|uniref:uncharacterized protein n=1 Tax=Parasteatoda tepidariorum TaxID=114398 RepID=UPI001C71A4BF|nr:uncharacterized protein LOC107450584 [Parasteatoda tepidariorum]